MSNEYLIFVAVIHSFRRSSRRYAAQIRLVFFVSIAGGRILAVRTCIHGVVGARVIRIVGARSIVRRTAKSGEGIFSSGLMTYATKLITHNYTRYNNE